MNGDTSAKWRHDLKNQIGIIVGFTELLLNQFTPSDPVRADLEEIHVAARHAMALVREMEPEDPQQSS